MVLHKILQNSCFLEMIFAKRAVLITLDFSPFISLLYKLGVCKLKVDEADVADCWALTPTEQSLVMGKNRGNRLGFALLLLFFRVQGRFPNAQEEIDPGVVDLVAQQLGMAVSSCNGFDTAARTWKRHRAEIRAFFGFRESTIADAAILSE
jgi:hypothetical protein